MFYLKLILGHCVCRIVTYRDIFFNLKSVPAQCALASADPPGNPRIRRIEIFWIRNLVVATFRSKGEVQSLGILTMVDPATVTSARGDNQFTVPLFFVNPYITNVTFDLLDRYWSCILHSSHNNFFNRKYWNIRDTNSSFYNCNEPRNIKHTNSSFYNCVKSRNKWRYCMFQDE